MSRERVEELRLEPRAGTFRVKVREERVLRFVEHDRRVEPRPEAIGKERLADACRALNRDVPEFERWPQGRAEV